jgi:ELP3 family radical SAM enzyme/protein acetyltransferase
MIKKINNNEMEITEDMIDWDFDMIESDRKMMLDFCRHPDYQADQWKIYPCETTPFTVIQEWYKNGLYRPYGNQKSTEMTPLHNMLIETLAETPKWVRINRIIRDIPSDYHQAGIRDTGGRDKIEMEMRKRGKKCQCIRCREIKSEKVMENDIEIRTLEYEASQGKEIFISAETISSNKILGFLRLRFNSLQTGENDNSKKLIFKELDGCALIRELHVYGKVIPVNHGDKQSGTNNQVQHRGVGTMLMNKAIEICKNQGYKKVAVIAGVGVRNYYREKHGFVDVEGKGNFQILFL